MYPAIEFLLHSGGRVYPEERRTQFYCISLFKNEVFMKKIISALPVIFITLVSQAQNIMGNWEGNITLQGNQIPIVFHISKDSSNKLVASFDSPSQHAFNLPCNEVIVKEDSVILMMAVLKGKYEGLLSADKKQISGTWYQGGGSLPLTVNKTSETATVKELKRPQTPKPPYPYLSEDVEYFNADKTIQYGATITYPKPNTDGTAIISYAKPPLYPAVILITGSGQQDRDETILGHKPFAVIADYLTKKGFLVLRIDDRGIGKTTGNFATSTTAGFEKDVEAGLDFLEKQPQVNKQKIGLIGHSEGGMIAPVVASKRSEIKFIVLLAGPGIPIVDLMAEQTEAISKSYGAPPATVKASGDLYRIVAKEINKTADKELVQKNIMIKINEWAKTADTSIVRALGFADTAIINKNIASQVQALSSPWFKYFLAFNPQVYLQKLNCKVLALNGSKDVQVISKTNLAGIKSSLQKSKSPKFDVIEIPGLNHLFQTCIKCNPAEYGDLEESFSPKALEIIGNWLQKNVN